MPIPGILAAAGPTSNVLTSLVTIGTQLFGESQAEKERRKEIKRKHAELQAIKSAQKFAELRASRSAQQEMALRLSLAKRNEQKTLLIGVAGIAAGAALLFVFATLRSKRKTAAPKTRKRTAGRR